MRAVALFVAIVVGAEAGQAPATQPSAAAVADPAAAAALRAQGLELGYNLDHREALAAFKASIAADPQSPAGYRLAAGTIWITLLYEQGVITVEDYLGQARTDVRRLVPDPALAAEFHDDLRRAPQLPGDRVRTLADDADAHYEIGAAFGFDASYSATIDGRLLGSLGPARRAYSEHERVLELNPARQDAGLIVGLYRCAVAELSMLP